MEDSFNGQNIFDAPPEERIRRCRLMADEAQKAADGASPETRTAYTDLAKQWLMLADEIAREMNRQ
jgi:hypothetical protein